MKARGLKPPELPRKHSPRADAYSTFKAKYRDDPAGFIRDCIKHRPGEGPTLYQTEVAARLPGERRAAVRGPHGLGKTALAAWVVLWFALTRDGDTDWKIPTTASAWRQLTHFLWPEVRKWTRRLRWDRIGRGPFSDRNEMLSLSMKLGTGEAFALASSDASSIEGAHATAILYVFDEAKAIPEDIWDAAEGAFSSPESSETLALAISTPGEPVGRFYEIHARKPGYEDWWARHVTLEESIAAGRVSREWAEQRKRQWGEGSAVYQNRVLGEFAASEEEGVIPLAWVEAANRRWEEWVDGGKVLPGVLDAVGVDVARSGSDKTVLALRYGHIITELRRYSKEDTMQTTGRVVAALAKGGRAVVDVIGVGAGVVDRLREQGKDVLAFNAGEKTNMRDKSGELAFADKRSAAWWSLREKLESEPIALPPDDTLTGDLVAPHWGVRSGGAVKVESKDEIRARIGRSTDDGDAVIQAFWSEPRGVFFA